MEKCEVCKNPVLVQIMKNTGVCSEKCRKDRDNDHAPAGTLEGAARRAAAASRPEV